MTALFTRAQVNNVLTAALFVAVAVVLLATLVLLAVNVTRQMSTHSSAITAAMELGGANGSILALSWARALDFAVLKSSTVFLGFTLVLLGALYLLKVFDTVFAVNASAHEFGKIAVKTTSPGLVMITLGVLTVIVALFSTSMIDVSSEHEPTVPITSRSGEMAPESAPSERTEPEKGEASGESASATRPQEKSLTTRNASLPVDPMERLDLVMQTDDSRLSAENRRQLSQLVDALRGRDLLGITVEGFGDPGQTPEYSLPLRERRALEVVSYLQPHFSRLRIQSVSHGEEPRASELTIGARVTVKFK